MNMPPLAGLGENPGNGFYKYAVPNGTSIHFPINPGDNPESLSSVRSDLFIEKYRMQNSNFPSPLAGEGGPSGPGEGSKIDYSL